MTDKNDPPFKGWKNLMFELAEDILSSSDDELLADAMAKSEDVQGIHDNLNNLIKTTTKEFNKYGEVVQCNTEILNND
tara:strand:- start:1237 stop:1470 length:234 start_codon:yes stop_codon:yes gene_type:complete